MTTMAEQIFEERLEKQFNDAEIERLVAENPDPNRLAVVIIEKIIADDEGLLSDKPVFAISMEKTISSIIEDMSGKIPALANISAKLIESLPQTVRTDIEFRFLPDGSGFTRISSEEYAVTAGLIDLADPADLFAGRDDIAPEDYPAAIAAFKSVFNSQTGTLCMPFTPASFGEIRVSLLDAERKEWAPGSEVSHDGKKISVGEFDALYTKCLNDSCLSAQTGIKDKLLKNREKR